MPSPFFTTKKQEEALKTDPVEEPKYNSEESEKKLSEKVEQESLPQEESYHEVTRFKAALNNASEVLEVFTLALLKAI